MRAVREGVKQTKIILEHCLVSNPLRHSSNFSFFWQYELELELTAEIIRNPECHTLNTLYSEAL